MCFWYLDDPFFASARSFLHEFAQRRPLTHGLVTQLLQQLHEPLIVSYGFNAYDRWRSQLPIEAFGFSARVHQLVFFGCSSIRIQHGDLLKARVKITTYYDLFRLLSPADPKSLNQFTKSTGPQ